LKYGVFHPYVERHNEESVSPEMCEESIRLDDTGTLTRTLDINTRGTFHMETYVIVQMKDRDLYEQLWLYMMKGNNMRDGMDDRSMYEDDRESGQSSNRINEGCSPRLRLTLKISRGWKVSNWKGLFDKPTIISHNLK